MGPELTPVTHRAQYQEKTNHWLLPSQGKGGCLGIPYTDEVLGMI